MNERQKIVVDINRLVELAVNACASFR